ncbi:hypothetical protein [Paenibacillus amylolyticus]|uniref:hypothetical protein n=1 Tax=Paenibacillus amylolyticus TaxID=1451 RepID=UPI003395989F
MTMNRAAILCIVETDEGISPKHWTRLTELLHKEPENEWIPYVLDGENNSIAYGFMLNELYSDYFQNEMKETILPILHDSNLEKQDDQYTTASGYLIYLAKHVDCIISAETNP